MNGKSNRIIFVCNNRRISIDLDAFNLHRRFIGIVILSEKMIFHFINENKRVKAQTEALRAGDLEAFFDGVLASGNSSFEYLQNVYTTLNVEEQGLSLALAVTEGALSGKGCAWRVHGGGFAGTIQAFVPYDMLDRFVAGMNGALGEGACHVLNIRPQGGVEMEVAE